MSERCQMHLLAVPIYSAGTAAHSHPPLAAPGGEDVGLEEIVAGPVLRGVHDEIAAIEPHGLRGLANRRDLTIRYFEFFDHYLKGAPAPKWMTNGVPFLVKEAQGVKDPN